MTHSAEWYTVQNMEDIDTPALLVYPARVHDNIRQMIRIVGDPEKLRPHVKTYKMAEIVKMQMNEGIHKFKCATIAEAEMLALVGVTDILLAYQPVGPKVQRLLKLVQHYPKIKFSTLVDNEDTARSISQVFQAEGKVLHIYIDLDIGNNRTGIPPENALQLYKMSQTLGGIKVAGLHAYDGHIRESDLSVRKKICDVCFEGGKATTKKYFGPRRSTFGNYRWGIAHLSHSCPAAKCGLQPGDLSVVGLGDWPAFSGHEFFLGRPGSHQDHLIGRK